VYDLEERASIDIMKIKIAQEIISTHEKLIKTVKYDDDVYVD
jgi:hypothetical protein